MAATLHVCFTALLPYCTYWPHISAHMTKMGPVGYYLSSNMDLTAIFILSHVWSLTYSLLGRHISFSLFMTITFETGHPCVFLQTTYVHEVLCENCVFYICRPYVFLHIYDLLNIPHLAVIFALLPLSFRVQFINILHLVEIFVVSHQWQVMYSLFGRYICLPYLCQ